MPVFLQEEELVQVLGGFFEELRHVEEAYLVHQVGGSIDFVYQKPSGRLRWAPDYTEGHPPFHVLTGSLADPALLTFEQDGDTAHRFWLGLVDLQQALARQQVRARGPLSRAMKLIPHLDTIYPRYWDYLERVGRSDLLAPYQPR